MAFPLATRQRDYNTLPRAYGPTGPVGQVVAATVSPTAQYIDLTLLGFNQPYNAQFAQNQQQEGVVGHYLTIYADGADIGIIVGQTAAAVSAGAAPVLTRVGTLTASGTYNGATGTCFKILNGTSMRLLPQPTQDKFLGIVASATGTVRMYQSSPPNP